MADKDYSAIKKIVPARAVITKKVKENFTDYVIKIQPPMSEKAFEKVYPQVKKTFGIRLLEMFTEETGLHFVITLRKPSIKRKA